MAQVTVRSAPLSRRLRQPRHRTGILCGHDTKSSDACSDRLAANRSRVPPRLRARTSRNAAADRLGQDPSAVLAGADDHAEFRRPRAGRRLWMAAGGRHRAAVSRAGSARPAGVRPRRWPWCRRGQVHAVWSARAGAQGLRRSGRSERRLALRRGLVRRHADVAERALSHDVHWFQLQPRRLGPDRRQEPARETKGCNATC